MRCLGREMEKQMTFISSQRLHLQLVQWTNRRESQAKPPLVAQTQISKLKLVKEVLDNMLRGVTAFVRVFLVCYLCHTNAL